MHTLSVNETWQQKTKKQTFYLFPEQAVEQTMPLE